MDDRIDCENDPNYCWGAQLKTASGMGCIDQFWPGRHHFKSKFCAACRLSIWIPSARVRALSTELEAVFANTRATGMWTLVPEAMGGGHFRVVNNTASCVLPALVVFKGTPPSSIEWPPLPPSWTSKEGNIRFCVAKGTLTPTVSLERYEDRAARIMAVPNEIRVARIIAKPKLHPVLASAVEEAFPAFELSADESQPSTHNGDDHPSLASLDDIESADDDDDDDDERQTVDHNNVMDARHMRRMQRNRESAATSRNRKRKYIADLEHQVLELKRTVQTLRDESDFWQLLDLKPEKIVGPDALHVQRDQASVDAARASVEAARVAGCGVRLVLASVTEHYGDLF